MFISALAAPNINSISKGEEEMAATSLKVLPQRIEPRTFIDRIYEGILMVIQKANTPSISISPAVIGLLLTIVLQTCAGMWWAASLSKDSANAIKEIEALKSENATQKVYIDNLREKQIKMEATQDNLVREQQVLNLMFQKGSK